MTRQVRIYEDDARLVDLILATKERGTTFADIISAALHSHYSETARKAEQALKDIEMATQADDLGKHHKSERRRQ